MIAARAAFPPHSANAAVLRIHRDFVCRAERIQRIKIHAVIRSLTGAVINTGKEADAHTIEIKIGEIRLRVVIGADVGNCAGKGILRGDFGGERFARHARQNPLIADFLQRLAERHLRADVPLPQRRPRRAENFQQRGERTAAVLFDLRHQRRNCLFVH